MATLRAPQGCPWDREQTHATLRPFLLEEAYEALDAIDRGDLDALPGELGDVLFQCVFHGQIGAEEHRFDVADVIESIIAKLIRRHPHVFTAAGRPLSASERRRRARSGTGAAGVAGVLEQWEYVKAREQAARGERRRVLASLPKALPALLGAHEIGTRVAAVGFEWARVEQVLDTLDAEVQELRAAVAEGPARAREELGDVLFSIANVARKMGLEAESALREANQKFTRRFDALEALLEKSGRSVHHASLAEMEEAWATVKASLAAATPTTRRRTRGRSASAR